MEKILISACLLGQPVRYDGTDKATSHELIRQWQLEGRLIPVCPEVDAGLPTPRPAAEIHGGDGYDVLINVAKIIDRTGADVTAPYLRGAELAVEMALSNKCRHAILTDGSPSCGSSFIYDGNFNGNRRKGNSGVTAAMLRQAGVQVWSQHQLNELSETLGRRSYA